MPFNASTVDKCLFTNEIQAHSFKHLFYKLWRNIFEKKREKKKTRDKETELNFLVHSGSYGSQDCARSKLGTKYSIQSPSEWQ